MKPSFLAPLLLAIVFLFVSSAQAHGENGLHASARSMLQVVSADSSVQLLSPAHTVTGQPTSLMLYWLDIDAAETYQVQWSTDESFANTEERNDLTEPQLRLTDLESDATYYWRVRSADSDSNGPWSDIWRFSTSSHAAASPRALIQGFLTVQNAAGPIVPPEMAAFDINDSGFPELEGLFRPVGSSSDPSIPTRGVQQSTSDAVWGIHTGGPGHIRFGETCENNCFDTFINRSIRNGWNVVGSDDYEWRFTQACLDAMDGVIEQTDCLAFRAYDDGEVLEVPFELWNVGRVELPEDDFQMIPFICEEACNAGGANKVGFDIGGDHDISSGNDDPASDWIYWLDPSDLETQSGKTGYLDFFKTFRAGVEVMGRTVLVLLDGGSEPPYTAALPEPGTVFRIVTSALTPPALAAPLDGADVLTQPATLYWNGLEGAYQVQVSDSKNFSGPLIDVPDLQQSMYTLPGLDQGNTYYWRVRMAHSAPGSEISEWSPIWRFEVSGAYVSAEDDATLPLDYTLEANFPNPFNAETHIRYAIPRSSPVLLEVFDVLGRRVKVLSSQYLPAGWHETAFDAADLPSGVYLYRLTAGAFSQTRAMMVVR